MILWLASASAAPDPEVIEVVVTASRSAQAAHGHPVAVEVLDRAALEASGAENVADALEEFPGIQVERTVTGTALRLQGMEAEHTLILIDGQRVLGRKDGVIDLERLPIAGLERIEIVKGPSSALFGSDAMGGVVNLITRHPEQLEVGAHLRVGSRNQVDLDGDVSVPLGPTRHRFTAGWHSRDAWDRHPETPATDASAVVQGNLDWTGSIGDDRDGARLTAGYQQRRLTGIDSNSTGAVLDRLQTVEDARAGLASWFSPGPSTRLDLKLSTGWYQDQFLQDQRGGKSLDLSSVTEEANGEASVVLTQTWHEHLLTFGTDGLFQRLASDRLGSGEATRARGAAFAQGTFSLRTRGPHLRFLTGARVDVDTQFGPAFTPSLGASATWDRGVLRASGGLGFRAPDFRELYLVFENPGAGYVVTGSDTLRPERSRQLNAGATWSPTDALELSATGHASWIQDLISIGDVDLEPGALQRFGYENIDRAFTGGGELGAKLTQGPVDVGLSTALTHAWDRDRQRVLAGRVPVRVTGNAGLQLLPTWSVRGRLGLSSPRTFYTTAPDGSDAVERTPLTSTVDLRSEWAPRGPLALFVGVDNLGNAKGTTLGPLPPRLLYAGLTFRHREEAP